MKLQVLPSLFLLLALSSFLTPGQGTSCSKSKSADIVLAISDSKMTAFRSKSGLRLSNGLIRFIKTFISECDLSKNRLAIVAYSDSVRSISPFTTRRSALRKSVKAWIPESGAAATNLALHSIRNYFSVNERSAGSKVLVLVTPQSSDDFDLTASEAQILRDDGVNIIGVGYGRDRPSVSELVSLTADRGLVFLTRATNHLRYTVSLIDEAICRKLPEQGPGSAGRGDTSDSSDDSDDSDDDNSKSEDESPELEDNPESDELNIPEVSTIGPMNPTSTTDSIEPMSTTDPIETMSTTDPIEPMSTTDSMGQMTTMDANY